MSFLTTQPEELAAAAGTLESVGAAMSAENVAMAAPTTVGVIPAAADEVSALQASLFTAYGTLYQQVSAEAAAMHDMFVHTLGVSAGTYAATEAANSSAAASPLSGIADILAATPGQSFANIVNIGVGNWASAASDLLGLTGGRLLPAFLQSAEGEAAEAALGNAGVVPAAAGLAQAPVAGASAQASSIGAAVPGTWTGPAALVSSTGARALQGAGWTGAVPQAETATVIPGMPGLASGARNSAGFGAPRYGVKPIVMPKPEAV